MEPISLSTGSIVNDRYKIVEMIGSGGMGTIFKVDDISNDNSPAVLKILNLEHVGSKEQIARFKREARLAQELDHPNIVKVFDHGQMGERVHFIAMEYVDGKDLRKFMDSAGPEGVGLDSAMNILHSIARAMAYSHSRGVIHRDIKPANILVDKKGIIKVADFGLAKDMFSAEQLTEFGRLVGTAHYMSPEQWESKELSAATDIYSFGILAFELMSGFVPFHTHAYLRLAKLHLREPIPLVGNNAPFWFSCFVEHCSRKKPKQRIESFSKIVEVCEAFRKSSKPGLSTFFSRARSAPTRWKWRLRWIRHWIAIRYHLQGVIRVIFLASALLLVTLLCVRFTPNLRSAVAAKVLKLERDHTVDLGTLKKILFGTSMASTMTYEPRSLLEAVKSKSYPNIRTLLGAGVKATYVDAQGKSALTYAIDGNLGEKTIKVLAQMTPQKLLNRRDVSGWTPLFYAVKSGDKDLVDILIRRNADARLKDLDGESPIFIHLRADNPNIDMTRLLLRALGAKGLCDRNAKGQRPMEVVKQSKENALILLELSQSGASACR
jgi:serine/threonine protein kinase